jgi:hypothetical protein
MKARTRAAAVTHALALVFAACACSRAKPPATSVVPHPGGDGIWFADGFGNSEDEQAAEASLSRAGFSWALLPAARLERQGGRWIVVRRTLPPRPLARVPVSLVIEGSDAVLEALELPDARKRRLLEDALSLAVKTALADGPRWGRVTGIHCDLPFTAATAAPYGAILGRLRRILPQGSFLSASLKIDPPPGDRKKLAAVAVPADGLVAMVFGEDDRASPATTDLLGKPWWSGYSPSAEGRWTGARGEGRLPESFLARISDDSGLEFRQDMEVEERAGLGYLFRVRRPLKVAGRRFSPGDQIVFGQPSLSDMIRLFSTDRAGWRFSRGRVVRLAGRTEADRIFTLGALTEVLAGRSLSPDLRVAISPGPGSVSVAAENLSPLASIVSRTTNWIEVDLLRPGVRDIRPGGFDRYEVYAANGKRVSLGRARRVRFYETLIGPSERIAPAVIVTRRAAPPGCCPFRVHLLSAAGPEVDARGP